MAEIYFSYTSKSSDKDILSPAPPGTYSAPKNADDDVDLVKDPLKCPSRILDSELEIKHSVTNDQKQSGDVDITHKTQQSGDADVRGVDPIYGVNYESKDDVCVAGQQKSLRGAKRHYQKTTEASKSKNVRSSNFEKNRISSNGKTNTKHKNEPKNVKKGSRRRSKEVSESYASFNRSYGGDNNTQNLFCCNLPEYMTETDVVSTFSRFGVLTSAKVIGSGVGFVRFARSEGAAEAIKQLNGKVLVGGCEPVLVKLARSLPEMIENDEQYSRLSEPIFSSSNHNYAQERARYGPTMYEADGSYARPSKAIPKNAIYQPAPALVSSRTSRYYVPCEHTRWQVGPVIASLDLLYQTSTCLVSWGFINPEKNAEPLVKIQQEPRRRRKQEQQSDNIAPEKSQPIEADHPLTFEEDKPSETVESIIVPVRDTTPQSNVETIQKRSPRAKENGTVIKTTVSIETDLPLTEADEEKCSEVTETRTTSPKSNILPESGGVSIKKRSPQAEDNGKKNDDISSFDVPKDAAVQIYNNKIQKSRVVFGPKFVTLDPNEQFTQISLSGGNPKKTDMNQSTCLPLGPDICCDVIEVETLDQFKVSIELSYNWGFVLDREDSAQALALFTVPDFIGDLRKVCSTKIREMVNGVQFDVLYNSSNKIFKAAVFGSKKTFEDDKNEQTLSEDKSESLKFPSNNLVVTGVNIMSLKPVDNKTEIELQKTEARQKEEDAMEDDRKVKKNGCSIGLVDIDGKPFQAVRHDKSLYVLAEPLKEFQIVAELDEDIQKKDVKVRVHIDGKTVGFNTWVNKGFAMIDGFRKRKWKPTFYDQFKFSEFLHKSVVQKVPTSTSKFDQKEDTVDGEPTYEEKSDFVGSIRADFIQYFPPQMKVCMYGCNESSAVSVPAPLKQYTDFDNQMSGRRPVRYDQRLQQQPRSTRYDQRQVRSYDYREQRGRRSRGNGQRQPIGSYRQPQYREVNKQVKKSDSVKPQIFADDEKNIGKKDKERRDIIHSFVETIMENKTELTKSDQRNLPANKSKDSSSLSSRVEKSELSSKSSDISVKGHVTFSESASEPKHIPETK